MKLLDDDNSQFAGVTQTNFIKTLENAEKPKSPETFVGGEMSNPPQLPPTLPATVDPKIFEAELYRTRHTYQKTFKTMNTFVFENWGFQVKQKEVHTGWILKKSD